MLNNVLDDLKRQRASFARDIEYLKETAIDDEIDERMEVAESLFVNESSDELVEAAAMLNKLSGDVDEVMESAEIDRILNAEEDLTFEEMAGIE